MEMYLFYATHLIMIACVAVVISTGWSEDIQTSLKKRLELPTFILPMEELRAIYHASTKERKGLKVALINILSIGMQIYSQLLK